jgi:hypothetical protein
MAKMNPVTKALRRAVGGVPGAWVRVFRDGTMWAGHNDRTRDGMIAVRNALEAAGYRCQFQGSRGTAGEYIIRPE